MRSNRACLTELRTGAYRNPAAAAKLAGCFMIEKKMATPANPAIEERKKAPPLSERQMSAEITAEFLQMQVRGITRMAGLGHIPVRPIGYGQGKRWLFYISRLDEWLGAQECSEISRRRQGKGGRVA